MDSRVTHTTITLFSTSWLQSNNMKIAVNAIDPDTLTNYPVLEDGKPVGVVLKAFWDGEDLKADVILWNRYCKQKSQSVEILFRTQ